VLQFYLYYNLKFRLILIRKEHLDYRQVVWFDKAALVDQSNLRQVQNKEEADLEDNIQGGMDRQLHLGEGRLLLLGEGRLLHRVEGMQLLLGEGTLLLLGEGRQLLLVEDKRHHLEEDRLVVVDGGLREELDCSVEVEKDRLLLNTVVILIRLILISH
jgi:hypothetical protein